MAEQDENRELTRRELRKKKRQRTQAIAYASVALFLIVCVAGLILGIRAVAGFLADRRQEKELARELEERQAQEAAAQAAAQEESAEETPEEVPTQDDLLDEVIDSVLSDMTLEDKVAGLFLITPEALTGVDRAVMAGDGTKEALLRYPVGGLIYFDKNIQSKEQFQDMIAQTATMAKYPLFFAVDEEGGRVARLAGNDALSIENVGAMGEIGAAGDPAAAYQAGQTIGTYLSEYGINLDFAPVADVLPPEGNETIGDRSFGSDAQLTGQMAAQAAAGLQSAGVSACLKHFPGLGSVTEDTHDKAAVIDKTAEELQSDLTGFQAGIEQGVDMVMVCHASVPALTGDDTPASLSGAVIQDLLRGQMGYDGIVVTDALNMSAVTEFCDPGEAAVAALAAGADLLLMPEDFEAAYTGVLEAVQNGSLSEERLEQSLERIYRVKYRSVVES